MEGDEERILYIYNSRLNEEQSIKFDVKEGNYSNSEVELYLNTVAERFEIYVKSKFNHFQEIDGPMILPESFMNCRVEFYYLPSDNIDINGWFIHENWETFVILKYKYYLIYEDIKKDCVIEIKVNEKAFTSEYISMYSKYKIDSILDSLNNDKNSTEIILPKDYVFFDSPSRFSWIDAFILIIFIILICVVLVRFELKIREIHIKKMKKIHLTYLISNFVLFYNTGMTIKKSLEYSMQNRIKALTSDNEIKVQLRIFLGMLEQNEGIQVAANSFNDYFGSSECRRFTRLLIQNLKQGDHLLAHQLQQLAESMWDDRIRHARKESEKASSKLIFPMLLIFIVILMITIIPTLIEVKSFM